MFKYLKDMRIAANMRFSVLVLQAFLACMLLPAQESEENTAEAAPIQESINRVEELRNAAEYGKALKIAEDALKQSEQLGNDRLVTESLYQISLIHYFLESYEEATAYMEIGLTHARLHNLTSLEADLLNARGVMQWKQGNLFEATAQLEAALKIKKSQEQYVSMASISNNLGIIANSMGRYAEAVNYYRQGIDWLGDNDNPRMKASLYSNLGESLIPLGMYDTAESYLIQSLEMEKTFNEPHTLAYTYFNLGELRSGQGRTGEAIDLYLKALEIQTQTGNEWSAALTRLRLSEEHLAYGRPEQAVQDILPGYEAVKRLNALTLLRDYAGQLSKIYASTGDEGLANYYKDLRDWFASRAEKNSDISKLVARESTANLAVPTPPPQPDMSLVKLATLLLLAILVLFLLIENIRLRKEMKEKRN